MIDINTMSVLIVDDMRSMRLSIRNMFKQLRIGKTIRHAENGREGWKMLNEGNYDLAVIDWNMPIMNGVQLLTKIRESQTLRDMPVIMVTAEADRQTVLNVAETEIDAYLLKPLTMKSLEDKIKLVIHSANHPDAGTLALQEARICEELGDLEGAINATRIALKEKPNASRILRKLGLLYERAGNDTLAEKCFIKAVSVNKQDDVSRHILIDFYHKRNQLQKAITYFKKSKISGADTIKKGLVLAKSLIADGENQQAISLFTQLLDQSKMDFDLKEKIFTLCIQMREFFYAKQLLEVLVTALPERHDLQLKLAKLYTKTDETEKALACYEILDKTAKRHEVFTADDIITIKTWLARYYMQNKKPFVADDYINEILKIDPANETALKLRELNT